jgi:polysaccharide export outer membrane protein
MRLGHCVSQAAGLAVVLIIAGCASPFEHTGPKFNAKASEHSLTNMVPVELGRTLDPSELRPPVEPFTLGPGDKIEVEMVGDPSSSVLVTVGPDGKIYYYLLPGLDVWGLTLAQTRDLLERRLAAYITEPHVSVTLRAVESKRVWLLGRLRNSGIYPVAAPVTLLESISMAGGVINSANTGERADLRHSFVVRHGQLLPVDFDRLIKAGDMSQNIYLRPDDFVYVPPAVAMDVYVLGAVRLPQPILWTRHTTLISVISQVGGTIKDAYLTHVGIVRGTLTQPKIAVVNYKDIIMGRAPDVRLEARDIVYVPFTPYKNLVKYVNLILDTFAGAEGVNEGARAVSSTAQPVGVQIGIGLH